MHQDPSSTAATRRVAAPSSHRLHRKRSPLAYAPYVGLVLGLLLLASAASRPAAAADDEHPIAKALVASAEGLFRKRDYNAALNIVGKALADAPEYLPALALKGRILEGAGNNASAADAYQAWLDAYASLAAAGRTSRADTRTKTKVEKTLGKLLAAERELEALEASIGADFAALAAKLATSAPEASAEAQRLAGAFGVAEGDALPSEDRSGVELSRVYRRQRTSSEVNLIARGSFGTPEGVTYPEEGVTMRLSSPSGGSIMTPGEALNTGESYVYETRFRLTSTKGAEGHFGLAFGIEGSELTQLIGAFIQGTELILHRVADGASIKENVAVKSLKRIEPDADLTLTVVVKKQRITVYVNGRKEVQWSAPREHNLNGGIGLWIQNGAAVADVLQLGRLDR